MSHSLLFSFRFPTSRDLGEVLLRTGGPEAEFVETGKEPIFDRTSPY